jgi:hypothetical protein
MRVRKSLGLTGLLLLFVAAAAAADISGKWTAQILAPSGDRQLTTTFTFKVEGSTVTGMVHGPQGELPISDGKIRGDSVTFNVLMNIGPNRVKMLYDGKINGDEIDFISKPEGGERSDQYVAKRSTS